MKTTIAVFPGNYLPHLGGLETHVDGFVKYLSSDFSSKYDIVICTPQLKGMQSEEIVHGNVQVIRYPAFQIIKDYPVPKFWDPRFWKTLTRIKKLQPAIVMTRTMWFVNSTIGSWFAKHRAHCKLVHVEHASNYTPHHNPFISIINKIYIHTIGRLTLATADTVVAISEGTKQFLEQEFSFMKKKKIPIIRRGYEYDPLLKTKRQTAIVNTYAGKKTMLFVGRLISGKGLQEIIPLLPDLPEAQLLIVGSGPYEQQAKDLITQYDVTSQVTFLGRQSPAKVYELLKSTDVFINPSYAEGLPTTVIEAALSGAQIVATDVGGTKEILGSYWNTTMQYQLVTSKDAKALLQAIKQAFNNPLTGLSKKLLAELREKFNWHTHVKHYHEVLQQIHTK